MEELHFGPEAIKVLAGSDKARMLELIRAEGVPMTPRAQHIIDYKIVGAKAGQRKYELRLEDGPRFFIKNRQRNPLLLARLKDKIIGWRFRPELVCFRNNEALMYFDKRKHGSKFMRMLRYFMSVLPFREAFGLDPQPHLVVCRAPARVAKLFTMPTYDRG